MKNRIERELITIKTMIFDYCKSKHHPAQIPCPDCRKLFDYASTRIIKCKLGNHKTTCAKCPVHCFMSDYREKIRKVMRFSGPRMLFRHPVLAFYHLLDSHPSNKKYRHRAP